MNRTFHWMVGAALASVLICCGHTPNNSGDYQALLDSGVEAGLVGVALYVDGPGVHFDGTAGFADTEGQVAWQPDHLFRIASNSKTFLGVVAAQLDAEGLLDLDAPLADYVSADIVSRIDNAGSATIRQALQHTTGIYDYLDSDGFSEACNANPSRVWTAEDALTYAYDEPASFAVGTDYEYSNSNYLLVGLAIDAIVGHHHSIEIRERILDPLGLNATFYEHYETIQGDIVHGYAVPEDIHPEGSEDGELYDFFAYDTGYGMADGGLVSTASDLARFITAVGTGTELLSAEARDRMFGQMISLEDGEQYGLGVSLLETPYGPAVAHGGGLDGYTSEMFYFQDHATRIVLFTNVSGDDLEESYYELLDAVQAMALGKASE